MPQSVCPRCRKKYGDVNNKISIAKYLLCIDCLDELARWESEGGYDGE